MTASSLWPGALSRPAANSFHLQLGDLPTWLLVLTALGALFAAILAYGKQSASDRHMADQVKLQGDALADQRTANERQAKVIDAQLAELSRQARMAEREQANAVVVSPRQRTAPDGTSGEVDGQPAHMVVITNLSERPIRNVNCRIKPLEVQDYDWEASKVAEVAMAPVTDFTQVPVLLQPLSIGKLDMIRAGKCFEFRFPVPVAGHENAKIKARFTDDAGLHWQVDNDQHLELLDPRDW